jgi:hypothetical protein
MAKKQSSPALSSLASRVLNGYEPTRAEIESLAASVLSQDEVKKPFWRRPFPMLTR